MSLNPKFLVTSGVGQTGAHVALQLREKGFETRAFVRRKDARSERLERAGVELFVGDAYSTADLMAAMEGCQRAYCCPPTSVNGLHFASAFAEAADARGVEHVVYLGQWLAHADHPSFMTRETYLGERAIRRLPKATSTVVAPGWFANNYFMGAEMAAGLGVFMAPLGDGDEKKDVPAANEDIAAVAVGALIAPEEHASKIYRPTGPQAVSPRDVAQAMGRAMGRKVRYVDAPETMFLKALKVLRPLNYSEAMLTQLRLYAEEYRRGAFAVGGPTDAVEKVGGRAPQTLEEIARRVVADRAEARPGFGRTFDALGKFMRIGLTSTPKLADIERAASLTRLAEPRFAQDSAAWRARILPASPLAASPLAAPA